MTKRKPSEKKAVDKVDKKIAPGRKKTGPVNRRRQLVDAEIYSVAAQLFSTKGFGSTSLQDIADAMGLSRPALYHYVHSKEEILARLIEEFAESRAHTLSAIVADQELTATEKLRRIVIPTVRNVAEHPQRFRMLDRYENELPEELSEKHRAAKRAVRDAFIATISEGIVVGEFRSVDANAAAFALIGMCTWVAWWFTSSSPSDIDKIVNSITDLAVNMVTRQAGPASDTQAPSPLEAIQSIRQQLEALEVQLKISNNVGKRAFSPISEVSIHGNGDLPPSA